MDIKGLDKATVLAALYNGSHQLGMGFMHERGRREMSVAEASEELRSGTYFDYLHGRVMKIDLGTDELRTGLYNRDNGEGAAERIVNALRK
jgi:hypothetical protein